MRAGSTLKGKHFKLLQDSGKKSFALPLSKMFRNSIPLLYTQLFIWFVCCLQVSTQIRQIFRLENRPKIQNNVIHRYNCDHQSQCPRHSVHFYITSWYNKMDKNSLTSRRVISCHSWYLTFVKGSLVTLLLSYVWQSFLISKNWKLCHFQDHVLYLLWKKIYIYIF